MWEEKVGEKISGCVHLSRKQASWEQKQLKMHWCCPLYSWEWVPPLQIEVQQLECWMSFTNDNLSETFVRKEYVQICEQAFFHLQFKLQGVAEKAGNKGDSE